MDFNEYFTVKELTGKHGLKKEQILTAIHNGYLKAINVGFGGQKPRWMVSEEAWNQFIDDINGGKITELQKMKMIERARLLDKEPAIEVVDKPKAVIVDRKHPDTVKLQKLKEELLEIEEHLLKVYDEIDNLLNI